ncbi:hypothetical protein V1478_011395 [Vespula squamosa]|uniref:Uncharacterized protein n=1 Tax=Vespula squamosa TaxID=30214 RepID=A0ABD2AED3_VESSQ
MGDFLSLVIKPLATLFAFACYRMFALTDLESIRFEKDGLGMKNKEKANLRFSSIPVRGILVEVQKV